MLRAAYTHIITDPMVIMRAVNIDQIIRVVVEGLQAALRVAQDAGYGGVCPHLARHLLRLRLVQARAAEMGLICDYALASSYLSLGLVRCDGVTVEPCVTPVGLTLRATHSTRRGGARGEREEGLPAIRP